MAVQTEILSEASQIEFFNAEKYPEIGVVNDRLYDLIIGSIDPGNKIIQAYIIDDMGRVNTAAVMCLRSKIYK